MFGFKIKLFILTIVRVHKGLLILDNIIGQKDQYIKIQLNRLEIINDILEYINDICNIFYLCFIFISRYLLYMSLILIIIGYYIN